MLFVFIFRFALQSGQNVYRAGTGRITRCSRQRLSRVKTTVAGKGSKDMTRDELRAIGGMTDAQIDAVIALHARDNNAWQASKNVLTEQVTSLTQQLQTAQQGIAAFGQHKPEDIDHLQTQVTELTTKLTTQAADFAFKTALKAAAKDAGIVDEDAITLLPGQDALRASKNQAEDIKAAFVAFKASKPYLFTQPNPQTPPAAGEQTNPQTPPAGNKIITPQPHVPAQNDPKLEDFIKMDGKARMELRQKNPSLFATLLNAMTARRNTY